MALRAKGILFDLDNTLVDRDAAFARWLDELGLDEDDRRTASALDDSGYAGPRDVCAFVAQLVGLSTEQTWALMQHGVSSNIRPSASVSDTVRRLAASVPVAVVTNGGATNQRAKLQAAELAELFGDRVVISEELGASKPDRAMFERGLRLINCAARDAVFVGDHPVADVAGAADAGLASVWVARGRRHCPAATALIDRVEELPQVLHT